MLLADLAEFHDAARVATRLLEAVRRPFAIGGQEIFLSASIGVAMFPVDGDDPETLLRNAGAAMHFAKDQGRDSYQFYSRSMNASALEKLAMEGQLRRALDRQEFILHYQPKVDVVTGATHGVEALVRWRHPDLGMVPPNQFIPIAEQTGLIIPIGDWVLGEACRQAREWMQQGLAPMTVSVNIASPHFRADLVASVMRALDTSGLDPSLLELEVTESMLMQNMEATLATLDRLKEMGLKLSLDDFGTGYSSLSYLKRFPLDTLKVDRSFIEDLPEDDEDAAITQAIIAMAHSLHLSVVAEGVETVEQLAFLQGHHCDLVQGFLFSKPVPPDQIPGFVQSPVRETTLSSRLKTP
ncbi:MAG: bifunctional diguanylate cyclase/phosphodiesterase [Betaproteobacteria bacterium]|nr:bifunctional diguanylate cyclase/phosphodiesterase [Betaproteobacteria bacterium]